MQQILSFFYLLNNSILFSEYKASSRLHNSNHNSELFLIPRLKNLSEKIRVAKDYTIILYRV